MLIVDDEQAALMAMRDYFTSPDQAVDSVSNLGQARELLRRCIYSTVLADLNLGGGAEGLEIVSLASGRTPRPRVVILTAYGSVDDEREARRRGADAFLHKPTPLSEVAKVLADLERTTPTTDDTDQA